MGGHTQKSTVITVTYTCGHTADFSGSPPRKGEINTCLECFEEVTVVASKARRISRPPRSKGANYDPDDW